MATPRFVDTIMSNLIDLKQDGSFKLNMAFFDYCTGLTMTNKKINSLFNGPQRKPESTLTQREMDIARSFQAVTEEIMLRIVRHTFLDKRAKSLSGWWCGAELCG